MQLFCRNGVVIATHADDQVVPASAYGEGVQVFTVPDGTVLERIGEAADDGFPDTRPFAAPTASPATLRAYAAAKRFAVETGGISVGGASIATDRASVPMISGALLYVMQNPAASVRWKSAGGFVDLSRDQIVAMSNAVGAHVQACFEREGELVAAIDAGTVTDFAAIDAAAWPANG
jgi:hypothetical protein